MEIYPTLFKHYIVSSYFIVGTIMFYEILFTDLSSLDHEVNAEFVINLVLGWLMSPLTLFIASISPIF